MVPGYYEQLGLLSPGEVDIHDEETNINLLFSLGLDQLAFLPFGYLLDRFRWDLYSGKASKVERFYIIAPFLAIVEKLHNLFILI